MTFQQKYISTGDTFQDLFTKAVFFGELQEGKRDRGAPKKALQRPAE